MKIQILASVFTLLFLTGCTTTSTPTSPSSEPSPSPKVEVQEDQKMSGTFTDLLTQGTRQCTYEYSDENVISRGTIYLHQGKMFGETKATIESTDYIANILLVDNQLYSWDPITKQGVQMDYNKLKELSQSLPSTSPQSQTNNLPNLEQQYEYDCQNWTADNSKFNVPTDINFIDLAAQTEQLQKLQNKLPFNMPADACTVCDQLSGEQKNECRKALSC